MNVNYFKLGVVWLLFCSLVGCGSGGGSNASVSSSSSSASSQSEQALVTAPASLKNTRLTLNVTKATPTTERYYSMGGITAYFSDVQFVEDASDTGVGKLDGAYTISKQAGQKINVLVLNQKNYQGSVRTTLTYDSESSGTFVRFYEAPVAGGVALLQEGYFAQGAVEFDILPKILMDYKLDFSSVTSILPPVDSPAVGQSYSLVMHEGGAVDITSTGAQSSWSASYEISSLDSFNLLIKGVYTNTGQKYELNLKFSSFMYGSFTFKVDDNKVVASGLFNAGIKNSVVHAPLKGTVQTGAEIKSVNTQITYPYAVYLPEDYLTSGKMYPVIYAIDGQWGEDLNYIVDQKAKDVILVQIEQGPWGRRMIDYSPVGGVNYAKFLKQEFIPLIESQYNTNHQRTFLGGSVGSVLGAVLLGDEPVGAPFFKNYILGDGTFWWYTDDLLQAEINRFKQSPSLAVNLFLSTSPQGNPHAVEVFAKRYRDRNYQDINIQNRIYYVPHEYTTIPTFIEYLDILF